MFFDVFRMPVKTKKSSKKSNLDMVNIEVDDSKTIVNDLKSVDDIIDLKDKEILGDLEVDNPKVS